MHEASTQPVRYRVVVCGHVGRELFEAFDHLELEPAAGDTALTGTFADAAQLYGLLGRLQDLGIPIVSVNPAQ